MSFADSWYRASCALLLLTLHFSMFSFYLPLSFSLSLLLSLSLSLSFSLSLYLCPLFLSVVARHMSSDALYQTFSSWSILLFHTISFHSSYKIHQLFTDYLLRLPSSELLEKHLFRSRANRRLVFLLVKLMFEASPGLSPMRISARSALMSKETERWLDAVAKAVKEGAGRGALRVIGFVKKNFWCPVDLAGNRRSLYSLGLR